LFHGTLETACPLASTLLASGTDAVLDDAHPDKETTAGNKRRSKRKRIM
jgi:hypothetical protein